MSLKVTMRGSRSAAVVVGGACTEITCTAISVWGGTAHLFFKNTGTGCTLDRLSLRSTDLLEYSRDVQSSSICGEMRLS